MDQLRAMRVFAGVIDEGGFAKAAHKLDMAPTVVTRLVAELEAHLNARLINRTTRRLALTAFGEAYLERVRRILSDVQEAESMARSVGDPRGRLRVLLPPAFAVHQLARHLPGFIGQYPLVLPELTALGPVETVDDSFDVCVLWTRRALPADHPARRLGRCEVVACASPDYLERCGRPEHPKELLQHDTLMPTPSEARRSLQFQRGAVGEDGKGEEAVTVTSRRSVLETANAEIHRAAVLMGLGIAGLPSLMVEQALREKALERVLPEWFLTKATVWVAAPANRPVPGRVQVFMDFLADIFGGEDRDPWLAAAGCETVVRVGALPGTGEDSGLSAA